MASVEPQSSKTEPVEAKPQKLSSNILRNALLALSFILLLISTPIALIQRFHPFKYSVLHVSEDHWLLKPLIVPYGPALTFVAGNIRTVSHNSTSLWIGGDAGLLAHSENDGNTWQCLSLTGTSWTQSSCSSPTQQAYPAVLSIRFRSETDGSLLADDGYAYSTSNPTNTWGKGSPTSSVIPPESGTPCTTLAEGFLKRNPTYNSFIQASPQCIFRSSPLRGWFVQPNDPHSLWLFTSEYPEGRRITAPSFRYVSSLRLPPPWYLFIALPAAALLLLFAWRARDRVLAPPPDSIANLGISDKPLEWVDYDAMGFHAMARGISLFLRNANTGLPLVLAVNGRWGSGKSSLMNLLAANMRDSARTVWFNAWHHQSEEQLLAALLQAVRVQSLDNMWSLPGLGRRLRLLIIRLKNIWPAATILVFAGVALLLIVVHFMQDFGKYPTPGANQISAVLNRWAGLVSSVVALIAVLRKLKQTVGSLIANPASLLASYSASVTISDLNAQTTFRQRFSHDFRKLIQVLGRRRLVIIIDDLDRCRPEKVREIMEAINFLVTSGECAVILGLARPYVEHFLGYSFKDVVENMPSALLELDGSIPHSEGDKQDFNRVEGVKECFTCNDSDKPRLYARLYLQKLIQIDVPVPDLTEIQARAMVTRRGPVQSSQENPTGESNEVLKQQAAKQRNFENNLRSIFRGLDQWALPVLGTVFLGTILFSLLGEIKGSAYKQIDHALSTTGSGQSKDLTTTIGGIDVQVQDKSILLSDSKVSSPSHRLVQSDIAGTGGTGSAAPVALGKGPQLTAPKSGPYFGSEPSRAPQPGLTPPPAFVVEGREVPSWFITSSVVLILLIFAAMLLRVALSSAESLTVHDSPKFEEELSLWIPLIYGIFRSPRALKRYLNKVRFLAMRQRGISEADPVALMDRWAADIARRLFPIPGATPAEKITTALLPIPDNVLIVLVALEDDLDLWALLAKYQELPEQNSLDERYKTRFSKQNDPIYSELQRIWPQLLSNLAQYSDLAGHVDVT
jgi:hypothetical protein